ncbi:MAG: hypothetical protein WD830_09700 [Chloroflexota bacterium]
MKRSIALALGMFVAALTATPVDASLPTPASGGTWAPNQRVEYRWRDGSEPPAWAKPVMNAAAADSNATRKAKAAIFSYDADGPARLAYTDDMPTNYAIGYAVRNIPDSFLIRIRPHGAQLDWGTLRWCQFYNDPPNGCYDLEMVTLHEFGHIQTLGHVDEAAIDIYTDSIMHGSGVHSKAKLGWNQHEFGRCDVARLQIRYEPLTTSTPISTCLDLPTELSLTPGTSSIAYGTSVTLTAKLKIDADASYPNLAGDLLSGRDVSLQRRATGSTAWTTIGDMSAVAGDPGRYVKTMTLTSTYDWRAVFSAPNDEGLRNATSAVSRLSVTYGCTPTAVRRNVSLYETC